MANSMTVANDRSVGDYSIFVRNWSQPEGGIHGYLKRFVAAEDPTFQHIAIWTLLQLLESGDVQLVDKISKADDITEAIKAIADRNVESYEEDGEDGDGEVVALARRCLEHLGPGSRTLVEG